MENFCEYCNDPIPEDSEDPIKSEATDYLKDGLLFCSDECLQDAQDDARCAFIEDQREWQVWGNDYDSWYR